MRRTETTVETDEVWVIKRSASGSFVWCSQCAAQVSVITPVEAAILSHLDNRVIHHQIDTGLIHYAEATEGARLVCVNSITQLKKKARHTWLEWLKIKTHTSGGKK